MECPLWASFLVVLVTFAYVWRKRRFSIFTDLGIPGPKPSLFSGNLPEIIRKGAATAFKEWTEQYGDIVGFYNGVHPVMIVKDLDLIKKIQIKDFGNFHQRGVVNPLSLWHPLSKLSLTSSSGERWKQLRNLLSPAFKTSNMRMMMSVMNKCCGEFLGVLESKAEQNKSFEARDVFHRLTMDLLVTSAFGIKTDIQKGSGETSMDAILHETQENLLLFRTGWLTFFMSCFPELGFLWKIVLKARSHLLKLPWDNLKDKILPIINLRRSNPNARKEDLLQLMLNAEVDAEATIHVHQLTIPNEDENAAEETTVATSKVPRKKRFLSDADIQSTAVVFLIAGFETTSTSLSFSSYLLAKHQDIQDRLRAEIMSVLHRDGSLNYDNVFGMRYLNQVVQESLRIMPPVIGLSIRSRATYTKNNCEEHHTVLYRQLKCRILKPPVLPASSTGKKKREGL